MLASPPSWIVCVTCGQPEMFGSAVQMSGAELHVAWRQKQKQQTHKSATKQTNTNISSRSSPEGTSLSTRRLQPRLLSMFISPCPSVGFVQHSFFKHRLLLASPSHCSALLDLFIIKRTSCSGQSNELLTFIIRFSKCFVVAACTAKRSKF